MLPVVSRYGIPSQFVHQRDRAACMKEFVAKSVPPTEINLACCARFLSPELRQSRLQTCRFAVNSSSRVEGWVRAPGVASICGSFYHTSSRLFRDGAARSGGFFQIPSASTKASARTWGINSHGNFINDRELINDRHSACLL